jgi:hypothetical protein
MPKRPAAEPDYELCLDSLPPEDRAAVARWTSDLGLPEAGWLHVPALRQLVAVLAIVRLAGCLSDPDVGERIRGAASELGLEDDSDLAQHPGERYGRLLRRWAYSAWTAAIDDQSRPVRAA